MSEESLLTAALSYVGRGWHVFPCQPRGKAPATPHGVLDATCDPAQIRRWWGAMPQANIGLACGPSGLVVIDVDGPQGLESWERLRARLGFDDATVCSATGNGLHFLFAAPQSAAPLAAAPPGCEIGNSAGKLGPGLDVRARGGYIIVPPSVHPTGWVYAWDATLHPDRVTPLPLPDALAEMLSPRRNEGLQGRPSPERALPARRASLALSGRERECRARLRVPDALAAVSAAPEGARNDTLNRTAFLLGKDVAAGRLDREATESALLAAARAAGLPDREARATIASALHAAPLSPSPALPCPPAPPPPSPPAPPPPSPWLDAYIAFSRAWSPRAPEVFHESCGLWLLSTVAARRVIAHLGGVRYTNLYLALTARSSLYAKSTTARIALDVLRAAGLEHFLAPDDATPQAFIAALAARLPDDYTALGETAQARIRARLAWAGQRGWHYEEFGSKVAALMRENGFMADFRGLLRKLDDCPPAYEYVTVGRGTSRVERPYLALLASLTPADLRPFARRGSALWQDGFWARFAFAAPAEGEPPGEGRYPEGVREIPPALTEPLIAWHRRLGQAEAEIVKREGGGQAVELYPAPEQECRLAPGVTEAFYAYNEWLLEEALAGGKDDMDGTYARLAEKALRVALLLGSLENDGVVELRHWQRGQAVAERWRAGLHAVYEQVNAAAGDERTRDLEERLLALVDKLGSVTAAEARRWIKPASAAEINDALAEMAEAGLLAAALTHKGTLRYKLTHDDT